MSRPLPFASVQPLHDIVTSLSEQVLQADAALQIGQQRGWNELVEGRLLLAGYDRLTNLGLEEVRVTLSLVAVRAGWFRRQWDRARGREATPVLYRLALAGENASMAVNAVIRREAQGKLVSQILDAPSGPHQG